jgi:hypothetical protein
MELCLRRNIDSGMLEFLTTDSLSHITEQGPSIGTPSMRSLYLRASISSIAIRSATNSAPNVELSTVFCYLEYQMMGARFRKISIPE